MFAVDVYSKDGARKIGQIAVDLRCGELFCDSCGDCIECRADVCDDGSGERPSHLFLLYADDSRYFREE